jgi:uncharacterized protein with NRDE domain
MTMCLILFAYHSHPNYPLIVAANRDEFLKRPTAPADYWEDAPHILAGRDLEKMGTWMGITTSGQFAALTNYRDPNEHSEGKRSRGELVADFLKENANPASYMEKLKEKREMYPGFNLLAGNIDELFYYSNIENKVYQLEPGIYGISNHLLNTNWPKVERGREHLVKIIEGGQANIAQDLLFMLQNADPAPDHLLPKTGVSLEWERILSPLFIKSDGYGTRSSTVLLASREEITYKERVFTSEGIKDSVFTINLQTK